MRSEEEVYYRLTSLRLRYLKRVFRKKLRRRPENCQFNRKHTVKKDGEEITIRLCVLGVDRPEWNVDICDIAQQAMKCPAFLFAQDKEDIIEEFDETFGDVDYLKAHHKDMFALVWVLGGVEFKYTVLQRLELFIEMLRFRLREIWHRRPWQRKMLPRVEDGVHEDE